ncbi:hypothetical protein Taro_011046 [Colocasia esculenta]|uniref:Uncharacterized protein n=1 Tax=Colocasia esculenta TaxID=4460 RepID=A0A843UBH0_COLES|nr:hypothetical protein [Colocasia esculenta]
MENGGGRGEPLLASAMDADCEKGGGHDRSVVSVDDADADYRSMLRARDEFFLRFDGGTWKQLNYDLDASNAPPSDDNSVNEGRRSRGRQFSNDDPRARTSSLCHFVIPITSCSSLRAPIYAPNQPFPPVALVPSPLTNLSHLRHPLPPVAVGVAEELAAACSRRRHRRLRPPPSPLRRSPPSAAAVDVIAAVVGTCHHCRLPIAGKNHRFTKHSDELRARSAWTTTARANFKHLMYNVRKNAERACASTDKNRWKELGPMWMRKEYWTELCNIWGAEKWNENLSKAKQNRAAHPEANVHTSSSVSFATHKARLEVQFKRPPQFRELFDETNKKKGADDYISEKAREVAESYSRGKDERYGDDSQRPELDLDIWVAASGAPKKGHVYGFGHSLGTTTVISSCSSLVSHATSPFTTPAAPGGSSSAVSTITPNMFRAIVNETVSQIISTIVSQTVSQMLTELGIPGNRAPPAQKPSISILFD